MITVVVTSLTPLSCSKKKSTNINKTDTYFKFNLSSEIKSTDPLLSRGTEKRYLTYNLHRGLYYYNKNDELTPHGANFCTSKKNDTTWVCKLKKLKYHNSNLITAKDYVNTFKLIKEEQNEGLDSIKNIKHIHSKSAYILVYTLKVPNPKFLHRLTDLNLVPRPTNKYLSNEYKKNSYSGPYYANHITKSRALLLPNPNFETRIIKRPGIMGVFIDSPTTALNLYEKNEIDFLRYLETSFFKAYQNKGAFLSKHYKLDGLFLSPKLDLNFRKFLVHSLKYKELKKIFSSKSLPGCLELSNKNFKLKAPLCYKYKKDMHFEKRKIRKENLKSDNLSISSQKSTAELMEANSAIKIHVPNIGRNDHVRLSEWLKGQWEEKSDLSFEIEQVELKTFYERANQNKYNIYRKSLPLEELNCLHAKNKISKTNEFKNLKPSKDLSCSEFFITVLNEYLWIPLGLVHNVHINAKHFEGYYINGLDQFGLENLERIQDDE